MTSMFKSLATALGLALSPAYLVCLFIALFYRFLGHVILHWTNPDYAGQLDLLESFFDREQGVNVSVINVVCQMKLSTIKNGEELRQALVELTEKTMKSKKALRLRCKIEQWMGLRYWQIVNVEVDKQIKLFDASSLHEFQDYLSDIANNRIHDDRLWEIHVSQNAIDGLYPVIMRAHHSVGDGYSLRQVLVEAQPHYKPFPTIFVDTKYRFDPKKYYYLTCRILSLLTDIAIMFAMAPSLSIAQCMKQVDQNSLRAVRLSGKKVLRWDKGDFKKVQKIQKMTKNSVTEILLTGFSKTLDDLFNSRNERVNEVTVVVPLRKSQESNGLANEFIPVGLKLPVNASTCRLDQVSAACRSLQNKPNYKINYFIPRYASLVFPCNLPNWAYKCTEFTSVFSNLPGPKEKATFNGFTVECGFFFVPNLHDNNGMGVTFATYGDQCIYSVTLDETLCRTKDDAQRIATGIRKYIDEVHASL